MKGLLCSVQSEGETKELINCLILIPNKYATADRVHFEPHLHLAANSRCVFQCSDYTPRTLEFAAEYMVY